MNRFLLNVLLALAWVMLTGDPGLENLLGGFILGFAILVLTERGEASRNYALRLIRVLRLIGFLLVEIVLANIRLTVILLSPKHRMRPGIVRVPLDLQSDEGITLLANLLTLTPGTFTVDIAEDRTAMFVHAITIEDPETVRREIKEGFERRIREVIG